MDYITNHKFLMNQPASDRLISPLLVVDPFVKKSRSPDIVRNGKYTINGDNSGSFIKHGNGKDESSNYTEFPIMAYPLKIIKQESFVGHKEWVTCHTIDPLRNELYSCSEDGSLRVWDLHTYKCKAVFDKTKFAYTSICIIPFQNRIFFGGFDKTIVIWDTFKRKPEKVMNVGITIKKLSYYAKYSVVFICGHLGDILVYDTLTTTISPFIQAKCQEIHDFIVLEKADILLIAVDSGKIQIWRKCESEWSQICYINAHEGKINCMSLSEDETELVTTGKDFKLRFWRLNGLELIREVAIFSEILSINTLDHRRFLFGDAGGKLSLWSLDVGRGRWIVNYAQICQGRIWAVECSQSPGRVILSSDNGLFEIHIDKWEAIQNWDCINSVSDKIQTGSKWLLYKRSNFNHGIKSSFIGNQHSLWGFIPRSSYRASLSSKLSKGSNTIENKNSLSFEKIFIKTSKSSSLVNQNNIWTFSCTSMTFSNEPEKHEDDSKSNRRVNLADSKQSSSNSVKFALRSKEGSLINERNMWNFEDSGSS
jgi:WD40 repeat protein